MKCPWCAYADRNNEQHSLQFCGNRIRLERDGLAALVGTVRGLLGCTNVNVSDLSPEDHSHEIMDKFNAVKLQLDEALKAIRAIAPYCKVKYGMDEDAVNQIERLSCDENSPLR